jgi:hypothetical protein
MAYPRCPNPRDLGVVVGINQTISREKATITPRSREEIAGKEEIAGEGGGDHGEEEEITGRETTGRGGQPEG